jgi:hypothetical protein
MTKRSREEFEQEEFEQEEFEQVNKKDDVNNFYNLIIKLKQELEKNDDDEDYIICESLTKN